ncbi:hypothetical protein EOA27_10225 [Mesorhizobium sp. M2A.F.Ca.ET.037.01.1.1]|uniref:hypothetical protein n=1 Tax=unclassified Mesorhizobium TaxID=325217 RepID=UPI000F7598CA|nr:MULTISPECIES: hypothetical protein [unclassified Mesorhizobium]RUY11511.1 hypothetical protein EOA25_05765 [Mesorhizobium sp. M2A.F.Ca.ET.040.01.1.1]RVC59743.1 hypothetical protein EN759_32070 [Mesorhizobium sp. M00.F.Ca.ET.038.03.1.1]RVC71772.1 hypothetical protein EN766_25780 [Mesorhizobium sp. M2A.F.Ca.ET.046.02.1.1]AZO34334.1 hypothetical protein EJ072_07640 [Mesorhizobium sp. M2A.F.Ca.ET.046.03.2.1]RUX19828.1 hypothetical protein EOA27_10225 [Mesorhizobium sp. M2A.F.Ca.ET.037.01.1.1]
MRRVVLPLILTLIVLLACYWVFIRVDSGSSSAPWKRTPEQNQGGNAPQDSSPAAGITKNPQDASKMPGAQ